MFLVEMSPQIQRLLLSKELKKSFMKNLNNTYGDGSFTPDTDSQSDNQNNNGSTQENQSHETVSPRKLQANRENAQKSTGPKTARGKRYSSFNALKHGLLARKAMFAPDGKLLDEGLQCLFETLHDRYSTGEVADELLIELATTDYWRLQKALEYELKRPEYQFSPVLLRYVAANRRAFDKSLQSLRQLPANNANNDDEEAKAKTVDGDSDSPETDSCARPNDGAPSGPAGQALQESAEADRLEEGAEAETDIRKAPATAVDADVKGDEEQDKASA